MRIVLQNIYKYIYYITNVYIMRKNYIKKSGTIQVRVK